VIAGVCITTDVDTLLYHMNNARYLRELDFARVDFYERSGLYKRIREKGGAVVQGACTIRYRRFVRPFSIFKITSKVNRNRDETSLLIQCKSATRNTLRLTVPSWT
jgi:acyl-CoA thioesterase FadM